LNFHSFGLGNDVLEAIQAMNFKTPTPVQQEVIPEILAGHDVVACAQTGTGKTAAFLLPIIDMVSRAGHSNNIKALVIVPTRELAMQIAQQAEGFGYFSSTSSLAVYGGGDGQLYETEKSSLRKGVDIVVCTPGRMISHINMGNVDFSQLRFLVLDEADRMLDMGFHDDIMKIISKLPMNRQSLLFSATMPQHIRVLARKILKQPRESNIALAKPPEKIRQEAYAVFEKQKILLVSHLLADTNLKSIIIFCDTRSKVKELTKELRKSHTLVEEIHSDLEQKERGEVMNRFKNRQIRILVATDIISRGIDVEDIDMIINFNVPHDAEDYIHRIGRTARAESEGRAITLISEREHGKFSAIERLIEARITKLSLPGETGETTDYKAQTRSEFKPKGNRGSHKKTSGSTKQKKHEKPKKKWKRKTNGREPGKRQNQD